jgi:hypothetical protein
LPRRINACVTPKVVGLRERNKLRWNGVLENGAAVFFCDGSGVNAPTPQLGILGRGLAQVDDECGASAAAAGAPLGAALFLSR